MATNPPQLFLLADHVKLSLLERQRAVSLGLPSHSQDSQISRSLEQLRAEEGRPPLGGGGMPAPVALPDVHQT